MSEIDDATLMAFADGALDEPLFSQIASRVETDPELARRLEQIVVGGQLAKEAFAPLLLAVPPALELRVRRALGKAERPKRRPMLAWLRTTTWPSMVAAATLAAVIAGPLGFYLADRGGDQGNQIQAILDTAPSGQATSLGSIDITPIATFERRDGVLCREFQTSGATTTLTVSCRTAEGWQPQFWVATASPGADYLPASGSTALDAFLSDIGAGPNLVDQQERETLARATEDRR